MPMYQKCPDCDAHNDPGESCECKRQKAILLTFSDGNEIIARINGSEADVIRYYQENNFLTDTSGDMREPDPVVATIKFIATGRIVLLEAKPALCV